MPVRQLYEQTLAERGYTADSAQMRGVAALERCENEWVEYKSRRSGTLARVLLSTPQASGVEPGGAPVLRTLGDWLVRPPIPLGVYMHGGVGRGKSFLMDCFFQSVPVVRKTRLHFHEFMREVHRELQDLKGTVNPLDELGERMSKRFRLICFDEFHVADVTDAMILHRLLEAMFANRMSIIATSNFQPDDLYPNGLHRDRILPAIALLNEKLEIVNVDGEVDYRQRTLQHVKLYHTPLGPQADAAMKEAFDQLAETRDDSPVLHIEQRKIHARRRAGGVVWFDFKTLCGGPRSQNDYLELATQFHTVLLSDVPQMSPRLASEARRFTWLIDVLYDRRVKLILSAAVVPEQLYTDGPLAHEFPRTVSRLHEMQSAAFLALAKREVDTSIT